MINRFYFYKSVNSHTSVQLDDRFEYFYFIPSLFIRKKHKGLYKQSNLLYLFWYIFTFGKYKIFYIFDKQTKEIAHFSNIMPKIFKYNFMSQDDLQILHCYTYKKYRGMRLYSFALSKIQEKFNDKTILIGSKTSNIASLNAIRKSGFKKVFDVEARTVFGIYYKIDE